MECNIHEWAVDEIYSFLLGVKQKFYMPNEDYIRGKVIYYLRILHGL